jgi:hypothetical protein
MKKLLKKIYFLVQQILATISLVLYFYFSFNTKTWNFYFQLFEKQNLINFSQYGFLIAFFYLLFSFLSASSRYEIPGLNWFLGLFNFLNSFFLVPLVFMFGKLILLGQEVATAGKGIFVLVRTFTVEQLRELCRIYLYTKPGGYDFYHSPRFEYIFSIASREGSWVKLQAWLDASLEIQNSLKYNPTGVFHGFVLVSSTVLFLLYYGHRTYRIVAHQRFEEHMPPPDSFQEFVSHFAGQVWTYLAPYSIKGARYFVDSFMLVYQQAQEAKLDERFGVILEEPLPGLPEWFTNNVIIDSAKATAQDLPYIILSVLFLDHGIDSGDWKDIFSDDWFGDLDDLD